MTDIDTSETEGLHYPHRLQQYIIIVCIPAGISNIYVTYPGLPAGFRFFWGGGGIGYIGGGHSIEDHYILINGIIF